VEVLRDRALLRARCLLELRAQRVEGGADLLRRGADRLDLAWREAAVVAGGGLANQLAERFGSSPATFFARSGKIAPASVRASSSDGMTWSSAQFESPRAQNSSSSSNPLSLPAER